MMCLYVLFDGGCRLESFISTLRFGAKGESGKRDGKEEVKETKIKSTFVSQSMIEMKRINGANVSSFKEKVGMKGSLH